MGWFRLAMASPLLGFGAWLHGADVHAGPLDDQIESLTRLKSVSVVYDETDELERSQSILLAHGSSYRFSIKAECRDRNDGPYRESINAVYAWMPNLREYLDNQSGKMLLWRKPQNLPAQQSTCIGGNDMPPILTPLFFLNFTDHQPLAGAHELLQWGDLWNKELLKARIRELVTEDKAATPGERRLSIALKTRHLDGQGTFTYTEEGDRWVAVLRPHAEFAGAWLIDESLVFTHGSAAPSWRYAITYAAIMLTDGSGVAPIPSLETEGSPDGATTRIKLVKAVLNAKMQDSDLEIDPSLAKSIFDKDTNLVVEPP